MGSKPSRNKKHKTASPSNPPVAHDTTMPLFGHRQSAEGKKRQEHCMYVAKESPEPTFAVANCELTEVPSGVFSLCKVLRKEALLLHDNWLTSLKNGGSLKDLTNLRILDLHKNEFTELPDEIAELHSLQVLNISYNKLKKLPRSIGKLHVLQSLIVKGNKLQSLPEEICYMKCLRTLDISNNNIKALPKGLCQIKTLENLILDAKPMVYPPSHVCVEGTEAIMKFLCSAAGIEYIPPAKFLLSVLDAPSAMQPTISSHSLKAIQDDDNALQDTLSQYERMKEQKRLQALQVERMLEEQQREQAEIIANAERQRGDILNAIAEDQERMDQGIKTQVEKSHQEQQLLVSALYQVEKNSQELMNQLLAMNEKARKTEELLEIMERERMELDETFKIAYEEHNNLREKDVLESMQTILTENFNLELLRQAYEAHKEHVVRTTQVAESNNAEKLELLLSAKDMNNDALMRQLMKDEKFQMEAFEALQLERDAKNQRITAQIALIEQQLAELSMVELDKKNEKAETESIILEQRRSELSKMLIQLMDEQEKRQIELKKRLLEMERKREDDAVDYWLVQYQRLLDQKPQYLIDHEHNLEIAVLEILRQARSEDYIPNFARHRVSIETLLVMTEEDLKIMGVHEVGLRKAILLAIQDYLTQQKKEAKLKEDDDVKVPRRPPSAPALPPAAEPSAPAIEVTAHVNAECVICMDRMSSMAFMPCGHVCCCYQCASPIDSCPMCRTTITMKVILNKQG
ncbi:E3 ubiquitin-protein ligase LRSAM1-like [Ptychodera flava]|uniref:E3 ubiquitin-protein ligase LRSAM1-like n=1 Tax=Ptychodera flava TaxID=63121 RepID=UPI003969D5F1